MIGFREIVIFLLPFRFGIPQVTLRTIPQVKVGWLTWLDPEKMVVIGRFTLGLLVGHFLRCVQADAQIQQGFPVVGKEGKKKMACISLPVWPRACFLMKRPLDWQKQKQGIG